MNTITAVENMVRESGIVAPRLVVERENDNTFCVWSGDQNEDSDYDVEVNETLINFFREADTLVEWTNDERQAFWVTFTE